MFTLTPKLRTLFADMTLKDVIRQHLLLVSLSLIFCASLFGQRKTNYFDGPYVFQENDSIRVQWVANTVGYDTIVPKTDAYVFDEESLPRVDLRALNYKAKQASSYTGVEKIVAISDIHGQYDIMIDLLTENEVIDSAYNWAFGEGHLVIVGDNFDRGDKVLDILWLIFKLEQQAASVGGQVHMLLGNHEIMVLNNDLRYLHRKYNYTSALFKTRYDQMFRKGSVLGDWLSSNHIMVSINQNLFVHGGISTALMGLSMSMDEINDTFIEHLIRREQSVQLENEKQALLYYEDGPLWYRGYFDTLVNVQDELNLILETLDQKTIVVGHTSFDIIKSLHSGKLIAIDCSIKLGKSGKLLLIKKDRYYTADQKGKKRRIQGPDDREIVSLFGKLYSQEGIPNITINTDIKNLIKHGDSEEYQPATLQMSHPSVNNLITLEGRARTRGNMRKKVCRLPPVKFDFSKSYLDSLGFVKNDKLKLVFPCNNRKESQVKLLQEYFLYGLYELIDTNALHAKLLDISIAHNGKEEFNFTGFLVEDEDEHAFRKNATVVTRGVIKDAALDRASFLKMTFFQYMISNTDWAIDNKHNIEFVKLPNIKRIVPLPYDFDYSGFVGQHYAIPHESLPIESVSERYFHPYKIRDNEFFAMVSYFLSIEKTIYDFCDQATYMDENTIKQNKKHLSEFFRLLRSPKKLKASIIR